MASGTKRPRQAALVRGPPASSSAEHDQGIRPENLQNSRSAIPAEIQMNRRLKSVCYLRRKIPEILLEKSNGNRRLIERQLMRNGDGSPQPDTAAKLAGEGLGEIQGRSRALWIGKDDVEFERSRSEPRARVPRYGVPRKVRPRFVV